VIHAPESGRIVTWAFRDQLSHASVRNRESLGLRLRTNVLTVLTHHGKSWHAQKRGRRQTFAMSTFYVVLATAVCSAMLWELCTTPEHAIHMDLRCLQSLQIELPSALVPQTSLELLFAVMEGVDAEFTQSTSGSE
jgi:hypothetical protein